jgi:hypothetical protein
MWRSRYLLHGSEPNLSAHPRRGMTLRYMPTTSIYDRGLAKQDPTTHFGHTLFRACESPPCCAPRDCSSRAYNGRAYHAVCADHSPTFMVVVAFVAGGHMWW